MTKCVLLAVEANQIQDLVFRSSKLRDVTGGSHALERFWDTVAGMARTGRYGADEVPVQAGGNLRAVFRGAEMEQRASRLARDVADLYAMQFGGRITVATAVADWPDGEETGGPSGRNGGAGEGAGATSPWDGVMKALAARKEAGPGPTAVAALPFVQPCASCGASPAEVKLDRSGAEVCRGCAERGEGRDDFWTDFGSPAPRDAGTAAVAAAPAALRAVPDRRPSEVEIGRLDPRRRVAYLLADGNGSGVHFREAAERGEAALKKLSELMGQAGKQALVSATQALTTARGAIAPQSGSVAADLEKVLVLPLIAGGDDVFVLVPARWAFWFAQRFAAAFTAHVTGGGGPEVTVSCALVFCKDTFPYRFAHEAGEDVLAQAKRVARLHPGAHEAGEDVLAEAKGVARLHRGRSVVRAVELRASLSGRGSGPGGEYGGFDLGTGGKGLLSVDDLRAARQALSGGDKLGRKRRHQMEELYSADDRGSDDWQERVAWLLRREGAEDKRARLRAVLETMAGGNKALVCAPSLPRSNPLEKASAMVDLLHLWDYLAPPSEQEDAR